MIEKPVADELVEQGYLRIWAVFEVLAGSEHAAKTALENHMKKIEEDTRIKLYKKQFSEIKRVEKPLKTLKVAFSYICESEFAAKNLDNLIQVVTEYGPSSIEVLEPDQIKLQLNEAQTILNRISEMMHKFAAAGLGGILIAGRK